MAKEKPQQVIEGEVVDVLALQKQVDQIESELMQNEQFKNFINLRNSLNDQMAKVRKNVEAIMVPAYKEGKVDKTIKGDWGSVTIAESNEFDIVVDDLPKGFKKIVANTTKIRDYFDLNGKTPKGAKFTGKKYGITMRFK